eukprot:400856-Pyramimonas_sp.AAC.1
MGLIRELDNHNVHSVLDFPNQRWSDESVPDDVLAARAVPLFKNKGSASNLDNYRPFSLLNSFYKLMVVVLNNHR